MSGQSFKPVYIVTLSKGSAIVEIAPSYKLCAGEEI